MELGTLRVRGIAQQVQHRQGEFPFREIGAEGFADNLFIAHQVEAVVVNLVGRAHLQPEKTERLDDLVRLAVDHRAEFRRGGKEGRGLHLDHAEVVLEGEIEIEAPLRLENLPAAHVPRSPRDAAADFVLIKLRRQLECMGEEAVTEEEA